MPTRLLWHRQHLNALCRVTPWWTVLLLKGSHFGDWLTHTAYSMFCAYSSHPSKSIIPISGQSNTFSGEGFSAIALFLFAAGPLSLIPFFRLCFNSYRTGFKTKEETAQPGSVIGTRGGELTSKTVFTRYCYLLIFVKDENASRLPCVKRQNAPN